MRTTFSLCALLALTLCSLLTLAAQPIAATPQCPDLEPSPHNSSVWATSPTYCGEEYCGVPVTTDINWSCDVPSPGQRCRTGSGTISIINDFKCDPGCTPTTTPVTGTILIAVNCDPE